MTGGGASFATLGGSAGSLIAVTGYASAAVIAGTAYGSETSGIRASTSAEFSNRDAFVLTDGSGANRFPIRAGTDGASNSAPLTAAEVRALLEEAFRSEEHTSELQSLMRISYAVLSLNKNNITTDIASVRRPTHNGQIVY